MQRILILELALYKAWIAYVDNECIGVIFVSRTYKHKYALYCIANAEFYYGETPEKTVLSYISVN